MALRTSQPWIPIERIEAFVQLEPALVILGLVGVAWGLYKLLLKDLSEDRHRRMKILFSDLVLNLGISIALFSVYLALQQVDDSGNALKRVVSYVGLFTLVAGATVFVKTCRILMFEYLFFGHMREGVPVLLVNLFSLLISIVLAGWIATDVFNIRLAPLLATSAIFSLVLGLALQDTLGNLFAGVALQIDKPYSIGDWIEVHGPGQKWVGQVIEVSWRATVLIGLSDEYVTIPNRIMGQSQVSNFTTKSRPIIRSQLFRLPHGTSVDAVREILVSSAISIPAIRKNPHPIAILSEANENWIGFKLVYFIDDYGAQFLIADQVLKISIERLSKAGFALASQRIQVISA